MISTILVANRGEIARRVMRTCRSLGIGTVAVCSDADANAPFVAEADIAVRLPGNAPSETYLRPDLIIEAALASGAQAIHPGYGFLSENADFARQVEKAGLVWIGPTAETIEAMGSKIEAKRLMKAAGVPVLDVDPEQVGPDDLPLLVKASAGGGGRGMRVVTSLNELDAELDKARAEAASAFGDGTVFVEPYLQTARHVEVQVLADVCGTVVVVGDRDCSIQRRHQKVVEEAPAPGLSDRLRGHLHEASRAAAEAVGYRGAGTVEFLVDGDRFFFLEMNTRLQVEHPVTECVTGLDLVARQIAIAEGAPLDAAAPESRGHAVEVRLYAEDPAEGWSPQVGVVRAFELDAVAFENPQGYGSRVDSGVEAGTEIGVHYDAMLAKVIAYGPDRAAALRMLDDVLRRARIHGVRTNIALLRTILADPDFAAGRMHTSLLTQRESDWVGADDKHGERKAVLAAALGSAASAAAGAAVLARIPPAWRNVSSQPRVRRLGGFEVSYECRSGRLDSTWLEGVEVVEVQPGRVTVVDGAVQEIYQVTVGSAGNVDVMGPTGAYSFAEEPTFVDPADAVAEGSLLAPMPAAVTSVAVEQGQRVSKGETVVVLEAMKMQHTITAPSAGTVVELAVAQGQQVASGEVLAVIEEEE